MRRIFGAAVLVLAGVVEMQGSEQPRHFTGHARIDFFSTLRARDVFDSLQVGRVDTPFVNAGLSEKSPWIAGGLSLALPGAGEFYSESYWKSAIFFAAEAAAWIVAASYDKKGDRQTEMFQAFADLHWSAVQYAQWMIQYQNANIPIDPTQNLPPWERVNWDSLNRYESRGGFGFTHQLPRHGEQQYYELIGKYDQYSSGWDDFTGGSDFLMRSPRFIEYSQMRGKANDYYSIAGTAISVLVVNHVVSAIDAFLTARGFSNSIRPEARLNLRHTPFGPVAETVGTIRVTF